ncbi:Mor transcription activator family protein, partial [Vibrio cholerae]
LSEKLGGRTFYFSLGTVARRTQRNIDLFADHESGMSVRELSKKY